MIEHIGRATAPCYASRALTVTPSLRAIKTKMTEERGLFESRAEVEMSCLSGVVKIVVRAKPTALAILLEAAGLAWCVWYEMGDTHRPILHLVTEAFVLLSAVFAFLYLLGGQEIIEFDREDLIIRRSILGWERVSRYPIEKSPNLLGVYKGGGITLVSNAKSAGEESNSRALPLSSSPARCSPICNSICPP